MANDERWLPVVGWEGLYEVSSYGNVRRAGQDGSVLKLADHKGYRRITLSKNSNAKRYSVHRLVLEAFVGPCPDEMECRHIDGNRSNNHLENLAWGTRSENQADRVRHGTHGKGQCNKNAKLTPEAVIAIRADPRLQREIADDYGISRGQVGHIKRRFNWPHLSPSHSLT
jgi:hypothetical protein